MPEFGRPQVWFHSDAYLPLMCDCGTREWQIDLPAGWEWRVPSGPPPEIDMTDHNAVMTFAASLGPTSPHVMTTTAALHAALRREE